MSLSQRLKKNVDSRSEYLVFGYIRTIKINDRIIPSSIICLCIQFYFSSPKIILVNVYSQITDITIGELDKATSSKCKIKILSASCAKNNLSPINVLNEMSGVCYVNNFKIPTNIKNMNNEVNKNTLYDALFIVGSNQHPRGYIIDTTNIFNKNNNKLNTFYWSLPSMKTKISRSFALYSTKYGLITIGNAEIQNSFNILSFDDYAAYKWKENRMHRLSKYPSATMVSDDKLICCGGWLLSKFFN